jgi:hypothetical protein
MVAWLGGLRAAHMVLSCASSDVSVLFGCITLCLRDWRIIVEP